VSIEVKTPATTNGKTDGYGYFSVRFHVTPNLGGWLVQHVIRKSNVMDCKGKPIDNPQNPKFVEYTEAWQVLPSIFGGDPTIYKGTAVGSQVHDKDTFTTASEPGGRMGTVEVTGWLKFIPAYNLDKNLFQQGGVAMAGPGVVSMMGTPPGWTDQGATLHRLSVQFYNCDECGSKPYAKATGTPNK
jgi:hypothetical protein